MAAVVQPAPQHRGPAMQAHLLGTAEFDAVWALQQRVAYELTGPRDPSATLLLCEHLPKITVGRQGSRGHIHLTDSELAIRRWDVSWVARGGGCVLHSPGQIAVYLLASLARFGFSPGEFAPRLQAGIQQALSELHVPAVARPGRHGLWGRSGQLVLMGAAVRNGVSCHGAFVNVDTPWHRLRLIETDPVEQTPASSLAAERQAPVKMTSVREALVRCLAESFGCERCHVHSGHPLLNSHRGPSRATAARVG